MAKIVSLVVKFGALLFVLGLDKQNAINMQLLGGVWILQTIVSIVAGLYTRWFHRWALLLGWAAGMVYGTVEAYRQTGPERHVTQAGQRQAGRRRSTACGTSARRSATFPFTHTKVYIAVHGAACINIVVAVVLTLVLRAVKAPAGTDETEPADYYSDAPSTEVVEARASAGAEPPAEGSPSAAVTPDATVMISRLVGSEQAAVPEAVALVDREAGPHEAGGRGARRGRKRSVLRLTTYLVPCRRAAKFSVKVTSSPSTCLDLVPRPAPSSPLRVDDLGHVVGVPVPPTPGRSGLRVSKVRRPAAVPARGGRRSRNSRTDVVVVSSTWNACPVMYDQVELVRAKPASGERSPAPTRSPGGAGPARASVGRIEPARAGPGARPVGRGCSSGAGAAADVEHARRGVDEVAGRNPRRRGRRRAGRRARRGSRRRTGRRARVHRCTPRH